MPARKLFAGLAASAVTISALALGVSSAQAAVDPDDTTFTPVAADLVGVGSDTSQHALKVLADAWNATSPAPTSKLASFAATGGGDVTLAAGTSIARPNGSGAGKKLLYGTGNNTAVDFARSSSALDANETAAGLQAFPFAVDELAMAVSGSAPSNAPATLTPQQIVDIYKGTVTDWSQIGGKPGAIAPKIPQTGSGTRSFFEAQLKAANGGTAVVLASNVANVQEHDDAAIKNDPNAIAPFSKGRAGLLGSTLRLEEGWSAKRALYNVVRGSDVNKAEVLAVFGAEGFVCSNTARPLIEAAGFEQLAGPAANGVCGQQTQAATSNFTANKAIATVTTVQVDVSTPTKAKVTAKVTGDTAPQGTVEIFDGTTKVAGPLTLVSGQATVTLTATPGAKTYKAVFTPEEDSNFLASEGTGTGTVKAATPPVVKPPVVKPPVVKVASSLTAAFPKKVGAKVTRAKGVVSVTLKGTSLKASGRVVVKKGAKVVAQGTLKAGKVKLTVKGLKKGKNAFTVSWAGTSTAKPATGRFTVTRKK